MRIANALRPEYHAILEDHLQSSYLHIDETSFYVNGVRTWVWVVATRDGIFHFVSTRKMDRIKDILKEFKGLINVDGYHTADLLPPERVQRCQAHFDRDLRRWAEMEAMTTPNRRIMRNFAAKVRSIMQESRDAKEQGRGLEMYDVMCAKLDTVLAYYSRYPEIAKKVKKVRNAGHCLFTFMKYWYMDPTNNLAERHMREVGKHRSIKVTLRTDEVADMFAILLTISMMYKDGGDELMKLLKKHLGPNGSQDKQDKQDGPQDIQNDGYG